MVEESIAEALDSRAVLGWTRNTKAIGGSKSQGPGGVGRGRDRAHDWIFAAAPAVAAAANGYGFGALAENFNMLDLIKATIVTPGLNLDGKFGQKRHPRSHRDQVSGRARRGGGKTGLYSFFIMFIGITRGAGTRC